MVKQNEVIKKEQVGYLKEIIRLLQNNDTEVIIFVFPQQKYFLDLVPEDDKAIFYAGLEEIKSEFNVKIYDLSDNYAVLNIWMDHNHVAYNKKSMIFSDDIYKIIIKEMELELLFNSVDFLVFFALVITISVIIKNKNFSHIFLVVASYRLFLFFK